MNAIKSKKPLSDTEQLVNDLLGINGYFFNAFYNGMNDDPQWQADCWQIAISKSGKQLKTIFKTGLGHRELSNLAPYYIKNGSALREAKTPVTRANVLREKEQYLKPVFPNAASVLYCLLSDMRCADTTFPDFCDNCGYDTDSRKALDTYLQCQDIGQQLTSIFSRDMLEQLQTLLEDY